MLVSCLFVNGRRGSGRQINKKRDNGQNTSIVARSVASCKKKKRWGFRHGVDVCMCILGQFLPKNSFLSFNSSIATTHDGLMNVYVTLAPCRIKIKMGLLRAFGRGRAHKKVKGLGLQQAICDCFVVAFVFFSVMACINVVSGRGFDRKGERATRGKKHLMSKQG